MILDGLEYINNNITKLYEKIWISFNSITIQLKEFLEYVATNLTTGNYTFYTITYHH